ncbi:BTB and MATH domain-containing protein 36-like [Orbicella faveolata]|uniref:BTB and MATH domain-containing protein 36-like n=1 Tax=Orbicella faveolata TaxID=48498 RepID=UPI0009E5A17A|nr:BTB and MATH domain-containing protein 36-like [Orbicella faveolata]
MMQKKGSEPDFSEPWHLSDVVFVVEDKKFHVHKGTLSMWSPVFEKMFSPEFREKSASEIPLPGKNATEIKEMLLVIYPTSKPISENNCYFLLSLAREYQMEQLTERCEKYLLQREKTPHQAIDFLVLANEFNMEDLCKQCVEIAKHISITELRRQEKYALIAPENGKQLAERRVELLENKILSSEQRVNSVKKEVKDVCEWGVMEIARVLYLQKIPEGRRTPRALSDCTKLLEETAQESSEVNVMLQLLCQRFRGIYEPYHA